MEVKQCCTCKEQKSISEFHKDKTKKDGYRSDCKKCVLKRQKQYSDSNRDKIRKKAQEWYENNKEKVSERSRGYRENNKEILKEKWHKYYETRYRQIKKNKFKTLRDGKINEIVFMVEFINSNFKKMNLPVFGYIYRFYNTKTKRSYIGQTTNPLKKRYSKEVIKKWIEGRREAKTQKFLDELVEEDFEIIDVVDTGINKYHLNILEAYYINEFDSYNNGYNNNSGCYKDDDGLEEFIQILKDHNIDYEGGK